MFVYVIKMSAKFILPINFVNNKMKFMYNKKNVEIGGIKRVIKVHRLT